MPDGSHWSAADSDDGCRYALDRGDRDSHCGAPRQSGSAYCPEHHTLCHVAAGSRKEQRRLREMEALANVVGGRRGQEAGQPPNRLFRRLLRVERRFLRP
jgi:hypothetical protein